MCRASPTHTFVDYIRGGCQINLVVAIDFTVSSLLSTDSVSIACVSMSMACVQYCKCMYVCMGYGVCVSVCMCLCVRACVYCYRFPQQLFPKLYGAWVLSMHATLYFVYVRTCVHASYVCRHLTHLALLVDKWCANWLCSC